MIGSFELGFHSVYISFPSTTVSSKFSMTPLLAEFRTTLNWSVSGVFLAMSDWRSDVTRSTFSLRCGVDVAGRLTSSLVSDVEGEIVGVVGLEYKR